MLLWDHGKKKTGSSSRRLTPKPEQATGEDRGKKQGRGEETGTTRERDFVALRLGVGATKCSSRNTGGGVDRRGVRGRKVSLKEGPNMSGGRLLLVREVEERRQQTTEEGGKGKKCENAGPQTRDIRTLLMAKEEIQENSGSTSTWAGKRMRTQWEGGRAVQSSAEES